RCHADLVQNVPATERPPAWGWTHGRTSTLACSCRSARARAPGRYLNWYQYAVKAAAPTAPTIAMSVTSANVLPLDRASARSVGDTAASVYVPCLPIAT